MDDDDEVLLAIAKELGSFVNRIGGPEYAEILLPTFEILLTVSKFRGFYVLILTSFKLHISHTSFITTEEGSVRDAASMSMKMVASQLPKRVFQDQYATMIASLATKEWFNARASAACLIPSAYTSLTNAQQIEHLKHFEALCQDVTPMVLRVAAQQLGPMLVAVTKDVTEKSLDEKGVITRVLLPLCETLASQKLPDSVRLYTPENCVAFAKILAIDSSSSSEIAHAEMDVVKRIVALFISSSDDRSWRVRWCAAAKIAEFISCLEGLPDAIDLCITSYEKLLHDPENEVKEFFINECSFNDECLTHALLITGSDSVCV
jgi:serine/threonine-protein phosphatase 2A regulatory subunit A